MAVTQIVGAGLLSGNHGEKKPKHLFHHHHFTLPLLCTPKTQVSKKFQDTNEQHMNSFSERVLHYTDLTIVTQTIVTMLVEALLIQQIKTLHRSRI